MPEKKTSTPERDEGPIMISVESGILKATVKTLNELMEDYDLALSEEYRDRLKHPAALREYQRKGQVITIAGQIKEKLNGILGNIS